MYKIWQYKYTDTPDGKDGLKKMFCTCKYAAAAGGTMGLFDLVFHSQVTKFTSKLNVLGAYIVPAMGFTAAYTATIYMGTNLRGKDDCWNYAFAALVTAGVIGIARKKLSDGFVVFPLLTVLSVLYKRGRQHGRNILDQKIVKEGRIYYRDLSLVKDYPPNYTKSS